MAKLRLGRKISLTEGLQTLYVQDGEEPDDDDKLVGMVSSPDLAKIIVRAVNADELFRRLKPL
jgi:hypothetical protein